MSTPPNARPLSLARPGTLWTTLVERSALALRSGALEPIATRVELLHHAGVDFVVRILASLARKEAVGRERRGSDFNPFLPYDPRMFVADLSGTHVALLNRFNVLDHHLLIVTRDFADQDEALDLPDFEALWSCLAEIDGLGFYNGGKLAGASQRHKHLQVVPLPLGPTSQRVPVQPLLDGALQRTGLVQAPGLPFQHCLARVDGERRRDVTELARESLGLYRAMLASTQLGDGTAPPAGAYNLLVTRGWMLLVPRAAEHFGSISVNSLGFAGALLVRDDRQLAEVREAGPMNVLTCVARPSRPAF